MRIGISIGIDGVGGLEDTLAKFTKAEADGFAAAWTPNIFSYDAINLLALAGRVTSTIELGTFVVPTYPRHPAALAQQALTTAAATVNRFTLGIGLSHRIVIENMFGLDYSKPIRHTREYLTVLNGALSGQPVQFKGEEYRVQFQLTVPGAQKRAVVVAALGPQMLKLAGRMADGTATWMGGPKYLESTAILLATGESSALNVRWKGPDCEPRLRLTPGPSPLPLERGGLLSGDASRFAWLATGEPSRLNMRWKGPDWEPWPGLTPGPSPLRRRGEACFPGTASRFAWLATGEPSALNMRWKGPDCEPRPGLTAGLSPLPWRGEACFPGTASRFALLASCEPSALNVRWKGLDWEPWPRLTPGPSPLPWRGRLAFRGRRHDLPCWLRAMGAPDLAGWGSFGAPQVRDGGAGVETLEANRDRICRAVRP
jgi:hypothetical protein